MLCKSCRGSCKEIYDERSRTEIECVQCGGEGNVDDQSCSTCNGRGVFILEECPNRMLGSMVDAINLAGWALAGKWPVDGGLLDQSNWFVECVQALKADQAELDRERWEKLNK